MQKKSAPSMARPVTHSRGFSDIQSKVLASIPLDQFPSLASGRKSLEAKMNALIHQQPELSVAMIALHDHEPQIDLNDPAFPPNTQRYRVMAVTRLALAAQVTRLAAALDKHQYNLSASSEERWNSLAAAIVQIHQGGLWPLEAPETDGS
jgi:NADH dehydrogenase/NADH:ubiquinone oxidoreductase subunit G